jgi:hypothetical protein
MNFDSPENVELRKIFTVDFGKGGKSVKSPRNILSNFFVAASSYVGFSEMAYELIRENSYIFIYLYTHVHV